MDVKFHGATDAQTFSLLEAAGIKEIFLSFDPRDLFFLPLHQAHELVANHRHLKFTLAFGNEAVLSVQEIYKNLKELDSANLQVALPAPSLVAFNDAHPYPNITNVFYDGTTSFLEILERRLAPLESIIWTSALVESELARNSLQSSLHSFQSMAKSMNWNLKLGLEISPFLILESSEQLANIVGIDFLVIKNGSQFCHAYRTINPEALIAAIENFYSAFAYSPHSSTDNSKGDPYEYLALK